MQRRRPRVNPLRPLSRAKTAQPLRHAYCTGYYQTAGGYYAKHFTSTYFDGHVNISWRCLDSECQFGSVLMEARHAVRVCGREPPLSSRRIHHLKTARHPRTRDDVDNAWTK